MSIKEEMKEAAFLFVIIGAFLFILGGYWYGQAFSSEKPFETQYYYQAITVLTTAIGLEVYSFLKISARIRKLEEKNEIDEKNQTEKHQSENSIKEQTESNNKNDLESLRLEYQSSQQLHIYYGKIVWQIGAIFLPVALGGFAFGIQQNLEKFQFAMLAIFLTALLVFFLLSYRRLRWLAHLHAKRCEELEGILGMKQFTLQREANKKITTIGGKEFKPQIFTSLHLNSIIPLIFIGIIWITVLQR